ncbi:MAG TPA: serine hydrolase domain-containing protein [Gaiellaceae bacterium]|jgi:CubicO group peptidase (beta-lactamase class C family)
MATTVAMTPEVEPQEVGLDPARLERLDRYLDGYVDNGRQIGSMIVITRGGKIAHVSQRGRRDAETGLPVESDTIWRIYSMTKPITSVAAMMLYEEGALALTDPVAKFIPSFGDVRVYRKGAAAAPVTAPAAETMTVWHLLTHTAGLTYSFQFAHPVDEAYRLAGFLPDLRGEYDLAEACDRWASLPLLFEPGAEWNYSHATDVVGRIIEVVSGQSLDEFFAQRILTPLGMPDTGFTVAEADRGRLAALYFHDPETAKAVPSPMPDPVTAERPRFLAGGHGLVSTAGDYHRFTQMLLRRGELDGVRLLAPRTVDLMTRNHLPGNATLTRFGRPLLDLVINDGYGFGLGLSPLVDPIEAKTLSAVGEYRWEGAAGTAFLVDPADELTVLFFTQALFAPDDLTVALRRLVYQALVGS